MKFSCGILLLCCSLEEAVRVRPYAHGARVLTKDLLTRAQAPVLRDDHPSIAKRLKAAALYAGRSAEQHFLSQDAATPASASFKEGENLRCCCKPGQCTAGKVGATGRPYVHLEDENLCCKERDSSCYYGESSSDASMCVPEKTDFRLARMCWENWPSSHEFIDIDDGCEQFIQPDGVLSDAAEYEARDCPFPDSTQEQHSNENVVRRLVLLGFHKNKVGAYTDITLSCRYPNQNGLRLNIGNFARGGRSSAWSFLEDPQITALEGLMDEAAFQSFLCGTLRLLPLLFGRIGFRDWGLTEDALSGPAYPRSNRGQAIRPAAETWFKCSHYAEFTFERTLRARRILRSMLATFGSHMFAASKWGMYLKSKRWSGGAIKAMNYRAGRARECDSARNDAQLAADPVESLIDHEVMARDQSANCKSSFPCKYTQPECAGVDPVCNCECSKAICWHFSQDFRGALTDTSTQGTGCHGWVPAVLAHIDFNTTA